MKSNSIGRTLRLLALAGVLAATAFGSTALAGPCQADCRADRTACIQECTAMARCLPFYQTCKKACYEVFGDDRRDCLESCKADRTECREWADSCRTDCKMEALDCKASCVSNGS